MTASYDSLIIDGSGESVTKAKPSTLLFECDHLRVETFTNSLGFLEFVSEYKLFKEADVILGNKKLPAYVARNLRKLESAPSSLQETLIERALRGHNGLLDHLLVQTLRLWTPAAKSHAKIFLLDAPGQQRAIVGSSNASPDGLAGAQEEVVVHFGAGPIYDALVDQFKQRVAIATPWSVNKIAAWVHGRLL